MIWKKEKNGILEDIIVEEIFRDKTGIKIYFGSLEITNCVTYAINNPLTIPLIDKIIK